MTYEQKKAVLYVVWLLSCIGFIVSVFLFNTSYDQYAFQITSASLLIGVCVYVVLVGSNKRRIDNIILATGTLFMVLFVVLIPSIMTLMGRTYEEEKLPVKDKEVLCYVEGLEITTTAENCKKLNEVKSNKETTTPKEYVKAINPVPVSSHTCETKNCGNLQISENECKTGTCCEVGGDWKWAKTEDVCDDWQDAYDKQNYVYLTLLGNTRECQISHKDYLNNLNDKYREAMRSVGDCKIKALKDPEYYKDCDIYDDYAESLLKLGISQYCKDN